MDALILALTNDIRGLSTAVKFTPLSKWLQKDSQSTLSHTYRWPFMDYHALNYGSARLH